MKVRIDIDKVAALKAGKDKHGYAVVEVAAESLTPVQRETLAEASYSGREKPEADFYLDTGNYRVVTKDIAEATPESVKLILDRVADMKAAAAKARAEKEAKEAEEQEAKVTEFHNRFTDDPSVAIEYSYGTYAPVYLLRCGIKDLGIKDLEGASKWAEDRCAVLNAERKAAERKAIENKKAAKEAGEKELRRWAADHGSELLRARIADGFEWVSLAEREFANSVVAGLGEQIDSPSKEVEICVEICERTTPTMEEIERLREVRKVIADKPASAALGWMVYEIADEYDSTKVKQAEVEVTVECPTGRTVEFYYACPAVAVEK